MTFISENMPILTQWVLGPTLTMFITLGIILIALFILFISIGGSLSLGLGPLKFLSLQKRNTAQENPSVRSKEKREPIELIVKVQVNIKMHFFFFKFIKLNTIT